LLLVDLLIPFHYVYVIIILVIHIFFSFTESFKLFYCSKLTYCTRCIIYFVCYYYGCLHMCITFASHPTSFVWFVFRFFWRWMEAILKLFSLSILILFEFPLHLFLFFLFEFCIILLVFSYKSLVWWWCHFRISDSPFVHHHIWRVPCN